MGAFVTQEDAGDHSTYDTGAAAWPDIRLSRAAFDAHLRRLHAERGATQAPRHAADLFLACARAHGDERALSAFEAKLSAEIDATLRRFGGDADTRAELHQRVRAQLFANPNGAKIAKYAGVSPLVYWVRLLALRTARSFQRERAKDVNHTGEDGSPMRSPFATWRARR